jgi:D-3-phosphoglycerate dehydrogenase
VPTVLITDKTWESTAIEAEVLAAVGAELVEAQTGEEAELLELVAQADAILTCFAQVTPAVVRAGTRLKVIGRYGIGVDNIAVDTATELGIPVTNVPAYCLDEVAEHVIGALLCMVRSFHAYDRAVRDGDWSLATGLPVVRVAGRTIGILGFGKIGRAIVPRARGLGLDVIAHDPFAPDEAIRDGGAEPVGLMELAERSDFVTVHTPLTEDTMHLVGDAFLRAMRPTAYLVNAARGAIVDQDALTAALTEERLAGAALDVFVPERLAPGHPLLASDRLLATPHVAFYSQESVQDLARGAAANVAEVLAGRRPAATVNPQVYA